MAWCSMEALKSYGRAAARGWPSGVSVQVCLTPWGRRLAEARLLWAFLALLLGLQQVGWR